MPRASHPRGWLPLWCLLEAARLAAQDSKRKVPADDVEPNRLWPEDLTLDAEGLHELAKSVCSRAGTPEATVTEDLVKEVRAKTEITPKGFSEKPGLGGLLPYIFSVRGEDKIPGELSKVVESCSEDATSDGEDATKTACSSAWSTYLTTIAMPFVIPIILGILMQYIHCACCFVGCCRCCRRQICCKERMAPRHASHAKVVFTMLVWIPTGVAIFASGLSVHYNNVTLNQSLQGHLCTVLQLADDAIGGNEDMLFLGAEHILRNLNGVADALDFDGVTMHTIRKVIDQTQDFAVKQEQLLRRVEHFTTVMQMSGPTVRAFEHRCAFCSLAIGDKDNVYQGYPAEGLLPAILEGINASSSQAMDGIREFTSTRLTGTNLTAMASKVKRSIGAFDILNMALKAAFIDVWASRLPSFDNSETFRIAIFVLIGISAMSSVPFGWIGFFRTRLKIKLKPGVVPSGKNHCCSWCQGFCYSALALIFGGLLVTAALFNGESCTLMRLELLDHAGLERHAPALGLMPKESSRSSGYFDGATWLSASEVALGLAQTCFTVNGTGDMMAEMELIDQFDFEPALSQAFWTLEERISDPPTGFQTGSFLDTLQASAEQFGGTFMLDPLPTKPGDNSSIGILDLNPNVKALLLGSSIVPEDTKSPDGRMTIGGLNSYAGLIAGPGKYIFQHGTAGGGFVITADRPNKEELESLPTNVRNALLYGRAKERLLASNDSMRCDELDLASGTVTERRCGVKSFHDYVIAEVGRLTQAIEASTSAALLVQHLFLNELRQEVAPTLRLVRDIRMQTGCRFLWRRIEAFDTATCEDLANTISRVGCMLLALAVVGTIGTAVHYKVWRHLKDNKVVGLEMLRFEKTYKQFQQRMAVMHKEKESKEGKRRAYQQAINDMQANAFHHKEVKTFEDTHGESRGG